MQFLSCNEKPVRYGYRLSRKIRSSPNLNGIRRTINFKREQSSASPVEYPLSLLSRTIDSVLMLKKKPSTSVVDTADVT